VVYHGRWTWYEVIHDIVLKCRTLCEHCVSEGHCVCTWTVTWLVWVNYFVIWCFVSNLCWSEYMYHEFVNKKEINITPGTKN
jgi:hypothetical protein